jgi:hypothetical protein
VKLLLSYSAEEQILSGSEFDELDNLPYATTQPTTSTSNHPKRIKEKNSKIQAAEKQGPLLFD